MMLSLGKQKSSSFFLPQRLVAILRLCLLCLLCLNLCLCLDLDLDLEPTTTTTTTTTAVTTTRTTRTTDAAATTTTTTTTNTKTETETPAVRKRTLRRRLAETVNTKKNKDDDIVPLDDQHDPNEPEDDDADHDDKHKAAGNKQQQEVANAETVNKYKKKKTKKKNKDDDIVPLDDQHDPDEPEDDDADHDDKHKAAGNKQQQQQQQQQGQQQQQQQQEPLRILYTVTTLTEYDKGTRATTKGFDRLKNLLVPVVQQGVRSMTKKGYHVDVCIISHYEMTRKDMVVQMIRDAAAATNNDNNSNVIDVTFWDNAAPISYDPMKRDDPNGKLWENTLALARQHRFVIKDNLFRYDLFCNFEDDMVLSGDTIEHYLDVTKTLYEMRETAPSTATTEQQLKSFYGSLTKDQLKRSYPGLMRVEVLLDPSTYGTQTELDPVPVSSSSSSLFAKQGDGDGIDGISIDAKPCCHLEDFAVAPTRPKAPTSDQLFLWETNIVALGVRHMGDDLGWMALLRGPRERTGDKGLTMADYWSGTKGYFKNRSSGRGSGPRTRPAPGAFEYINNQGGWMGTRQQIWEWHTEICLGGFLPPFDSPHYNFDGLDPRNVEYWSGGLNLFTARHACNMQRLVSLDPAGFSKQLIYHSANNKQRHLSGKKSSFVKINDLYGQLLTVTEDANEQMTKETTRA